jgi:hypothetical protein
MLDSLNKSVVESLAIHCETVISVDPSLDNFLDYGSISAILDDAQSSWEKFRRDFLKNEFRDQDIPYSWVLVCFSVGEEAAMESRSFAEIEKIAHKIHTEKWVKSVF